MPIFIDENTRILVQGITGNVGSFQTSIMKEYGSKIVAGVTPGKGGQKVYGIPVYNLVSQAVAEHEIDAAISYVPAAFAKMAAYEVISSGIPFLVLTTEGIPENDIVSIMRYAQLAGCRVLGPDTPGLISPGKCKLGVHPHQMLMEGSVGVVSKSGSLSYEVCRVLTEAGIGQSSVVGIGGGPIWGTTHEEVLREYENDPQTKAVVLLGEVGGKLEHRAAMYIKEHMSKPVVAMIVGRSAPPGAQMGHAGAIVEGEEGTAASKLAALSKAGASTARTPQEIVKILKNIGV
ncbi:succinate--CoA ligase subunit alpha [Dethiosulfatarculus sandiegensis]|uniref:Succinyl-CoA synthetase subunit alpha n=1 Tax=Dethiosulfatarculus sandiegensis TaxID=1429043 RepID=A0A0D2K052_9BACT|nr:succinate--CoA ligase subunit alpha [Dethiosulfatarculus sandiegensis]KIX15115.1 succinyl-CoA synthetase subunit alpha [Dethiosulfatarculus sandiegensis]